MSSSAFTYNVSDNRGIGYYKCVDLTLYRPVRNGVNPFQFLFFYRSVERQIYLNPVQMAKADRAFKHVGRKVIGFLPGIELVKAQIYCIRTRIYRRAEIFRIAGGCENFGFMHKFQRSLALNLRFNERRILDTWSFTSESFKVRSALLNVHVRAMLI